MASPRILICATGTKGLEFVRHALGSFDVCAVVSYPQSNVTDDAYQHIAALCKSSSIHCVEQKRPDFNSLPPFDVCFLVGWQFLLPQTDQRFIVFHDSLLPKYRGYGPTISALLDGETRIGVSALLPVTAMDAGPILGQEAIDISYPITITQAFKHLSGCYNRLADHIVRAYIKGDYQSLAKPQNERLATYSLWRDAEDQWIDWSMPSDYIERLVNALTYPYTGARTLFEGQELIIHDVRTEAETVFAERHPGKFWLLQDNQPTIVCGTGMLTILKATDTNGTPVQFTRLRTRFTNR